MPPDLLPDSAPGGPRSGRWTSLLLVLLLPSAGLDFNEINNLNFDFLVDGLEGFEIVGDEAISEEVIL